MAQETESERLMRAGIASTIRRMKKEGTVGCSMANLKQCLPSMALTCSVWAYNAMFARLAPEVAKQLRFNLYE